MGAGGRAKGEEGGWKEEAAPTPPYAWYEYRLKLLYVALLPEGNRVCMAFIAACGKDQPSMRTPPAADCLSRTQHATWIMPQAAADHQLCRAEPERPATMALQVDRRW